MSRDPRPGRGTLLVWAGEDKDHWQGATQVPVVHSVSFGYQDLDHWQSVALGQAPGHIYSRNTNPTVTAFEEKVRQLEGAGAATSFATGMPPSAIPSTRCWRPVTGWCPSRIPTVAPTKCSASFCPTGA